MWFIKLLPAFLILSLSVSADAVLPNDQYFPMQWALKNDGTQTVHLDKDDLNSETRHGTVGVDIGWADAQADLSLIQNFSPVTVAVIDSGMDVGHPDLVGRIAPGGFNFLAGAKDLTAQQNLEDDMGHGTHTGGTIVANANNKIGITGATSAAVKVLPLRVLSHSFTRFAYNGRMISEYVADAVRYAISKNAAVINLSLTWPKLVDSESARSAIQEAIQKGIVVVAAAGNERKQKPAFPCSYPGVLCVGAITNTGDLSGYSNYGGNVDILGPGDDIIGPYPRDLDSLLRIRGYEKMSGTSMASPLVAAVAAELRSSHPEWSATEVIARILSSARQMKGQENTLYGLVNLKRALEAKPEPVFMPDFKSAGKSPDEFLVDEHTLQITGSLGVRNLWATATAVHMEIMANGKLAGAKDFASVGSAPVQVPWTHSFTSLDESSDVVLTLKVSYGSETREFKTQISAVRPMLGLPGKVLTYTQSDLGKNLDWIGISNQALSLKLNRVQTYGKSTGHPIYYRQTQTGGTDKPALVQIVKTEGAGSIQTVSVPGAQTLSQIVRLDLKKSGEQDWAFIGLGSDATGSYLQFYFLNPKFQPLWGSQSSWRISMKGPYTDFLLRNYSQAGSWIWMKDKLVPSFSEQTLLPKPDDYDGLDARQLQPARHILYLNPLGFSAQSSFPSPFIPLEVRAIDSWKYRSHFPELFILNLAPITPTEMRAGEIRYFATQDTELDTPVAVLDASSVTEVTLKLAPEWRVTSILGTAISSPPNQTSAYLNFDDSAHGNFSWSDAFGGVDFSHFQFQEILNPITSAIGAFNFGKNGRFWVLETNFDLVAFQEDATGNQSHYKLPIERDTSFSEQQLNEMASPVLVGTTANPLPAVYIDSTLLRGNQISVAVINPEAHRFEKPLRYSLQVPEGCLQVNPLQLTDRVESFTLPLFCKKGLAIDYHLIQP
jgi:hypothetical protein